MASYEDEVVAKLQALNSARIASRANKEYVPTSMTKSPSAEAERRTGGKPRTVVSGVEVPTASSSYRSDWSTGEQKQEKEEDRKREEGDMIRASELLWRGGANKPVATDPAAAGLSGDQRALVAAQAQLWDAIQADRAENAKMQPGARQEMMQGEDYAAAVDALFGRDRGSNTYAPRTVALLTEMGMQSDKTDLDQYLSGSALMSNEEVMASDSMEGQNKGTYQYKIGNRLGGAATSDRLRATLDNGYSILASLGSQTGMSFVEGMGKEEAEAKQANQLAPDQVENLRYLMADMAMAEQPANLADNYNALKEAYGLDDNKIGEFLRQELALWESGDTVFPEGYISPEEFRAKWKVSN
jgi:hypothetical protein